MSTENIPPTGGWSLEGNTGEANATAPAEQSPTYGYGQPGYGYASQPGYTSQQSGYSQSPYEQPGYGGATQAGYAPSGTFTYAQAKPGILPIRPLTLGDIFAGTFAMLRYNPKVIFGFPAIAVGVATVINLAILALTKGSGPVTDYDALPAAFISLSFTGTLLPSLLVFILASGPLTIATVEAVKGNKISMGEVWQQFKKRFFPYLGVSLVIFVSTILLNAVLATAFVVLLTYFGASNVSFVTGAVVFILLVLLGFAAFLGLTIKFMFAAAICVLQRKGVAASIVESWRLSHKGFFRLVGFTLLFSFALGIISNVVQTPLFILASLPAFMASANLDTALVLTMVMMSLIISLSMLIVQPLTISFYSLLYVDQRIRLQGYDIELFASGQLK